MIKFDGTIMPRSVTPYNIYQGITDWGNLQQFDFYEKGYQYLIVLKVPAFINTLSQDDTDIATLQKNYKHILQYEFKGIDGIEDITSATVEINDGSGVLNLINDVIQQSGSTFQFTGYRERSGSILTKMHELILTGIKDGRSKLKTYHGLIEAGKMEKDYQNEIMSFMYIVTDNTGLGIEKAYAIISAQPTKADCSIYNGTKGEFEHPELTVEFNGFITSGNDITAKAAQLLKALIITRNSDKFVYTDQGQRDPALKPSGKLN